MSADAGLYQEIEGRIEEAVRGQGVRLSTVRRLALLTTGLVAAKRSAMGPLASGVWEVGASTARVASIERRLRRSLNDRGLTAQRCYAPAARTMLGRSGLVARPRPVGGTGWSG